MPEWTTHLCKVPRKNSSALPANCRRLCEVYHITHLSEAKRILLDGVIRSSPIVEGSRLCRSRTPVSWLSANDWSPGSKYGTVRFTFNWNTILSKRKMYWVESQKDYRWPAFRFLLTQFDPPRHKKISLYDPRKHRGPVRKRRGSWYYRCDRTSHFLIEGDLSIDLCEKIDFVDHVDGKCVHYCDSCTEKGRLSQQTNPRMMAYILGRDIHSANNFFNPEVAKSLGDFGIRHLVRELKEGDWKFSGTVRKRSCREAILRGALLLYDSGFDEEAKIVLSQLSSEKVFHRAVQEIVSDHFDLTRYRIRR